MALALCACGSKPEAPAEAKIKIGMVTDVGGVNDKSFNQTSWEGLQALQAEDPSFEVKYLESKTDADYQTNINTFIDEGTDLIWIAYNRKQAFSILRIRLVAHAADVEFTVFVGLVCERLASGGFYGE